jgi:hypothetical protein
MDKVTEISQKAALIALSQSNPTARSFFQSLAARDRDAAETTVDRVMSIVNTERNEAVALMKAVADTGVAEFYAGRRGHKTRLVWDYSCKSVGSAALEQFASLQIPDFEIDSDDSVRIEQQIPASEGPIARAKRILAAELGVSVDNVEIIIRS